MKITALNCHRVFAELSADVTVASFEFARPARGPVSPIVGLLNADGFDVYEARLVVALNEDTVAKAARRLSLSASVL